MIEVTIPKQATNTRRTCLECVIHIRSVLKKKLLDETISEAGKKKIRKWLTTTNQKVHSDQCTFCRCPADECRRYD